MQARARPTRAVRSLGSPRDTEGGWFHALPAHHFPDRRPRIGRDLATACGDDNKLDSAEATEHHEEAARSSIGSAGFTEIQLMAEMYKLLLDKAGYTASIKVVQNREVYEPALEKGDIDVVPDYAATMAEFLNVKKNGPTAKLGRDQRQGRDRRCAERAGRAPRHQGAHGRRGGRPERVRRDQGGCRREGQQAFRLGG